MPVGARAPRRRLTPLVVVRKENGGKIDAINTGINLARYPLVCMVDADSILDPDALLVVSKPFADDPLRVVATGGVIRAVNGCRVVAGRVVEVRMPRGGWPGSRSWSTCARSCSGAPAGRGSAA